MEIIKNYINKIMILILQKVKLLINLHYIISKDIIFLLKTEAL